MVYIFEEKMELLKENTPIEKEKETFFIEEKKEITRFKIVENMDYFK